MSKPSKITNKSTSTICKICGVKMSSFTALGGHVSKAHPNMSGAFSKRMRIWEERTLERSMLQAAKDVFLKTKPGGDFNEQRNRLSYLKLKIRKLVGEEKSETSIKNSADILIE